MNRELYVRKHLLWVDQDLLDKATGLIHHLVPSDFAFLPVGLEVKFSTRSNGWASYVATKSSSALHSNPMGIKQDLRETSML